MKNALILLSIMAVAILSGCGTVPETIVQQPLTARPQPISTARSNNGAIFQSSAYRPMFEDRRARMVGDLITIAISEKTSATKSSAASGAKTGGGSYTGSSNLPHALGLTSASTSSLGLSTATSNKFEDKGAESASNTFSGNIGVTVIDVLPNGNLVVSGEKQIAFDKGVEFVRFSGVVNPDSITTGNIVSSSQVADAKVEYRTNSRIDKSEFISQLARFFFSIAPM